MDSRSDNNRGQAASEVGMTSGSFGRQSGIDDTGEVLGESPRSDFAVGHAAAPSRLGGQSASGSPAQEASMRTVDFKPPRPPLHEAPARFGVAGFSAGDAYLVKTELHETPDPRLGEPPDALAQGLGWFSIGLGLFEVLGAEGLARWLGAEDRRAVVRAYGFREIGNGIALLAQKDVRARSPWLWTRVAGDALDLYSLKKLHHDDNPNKGNVKLAIAAVAGVMLLDVMAAGLLAER